MLVRKCNCCGKELKESLDKTDHFKSIQTYLYNKKIRGAYSDSFDLCITCYKEIIISNIKEFN